MNEQIEQRILEAFEEIFNNGKPIPIRGAGPSDVAQVIRNVDTLRALFLSGICVDKDKLAENLGSTKALKEAYIIFVAQVNDACADYIKDLTGIGDGL